MNYFGLTNLATSGIKNYCFSSVTSGIKNLCSGGVKNGGSFGLLNLLATVYNSQALALVVAGIAVACFTVVFTILFVSYRKFAVAEIDSGKRDIELIELFFRNRKKSVIRRKKILQVVKFISYTLLMAFITVCLVFTAFVRFSENLPFGTKSFMVVATDSMSYKYGNESDGNSYLFTHNLDNQFPANCIIIIEKVEESDLKLYDVIAYKHPSGVTYIHRITRIDVAEDGSKTYRTRGDTNKDDDQIASIYTGSLTYDEIIGKYTNVYIPFLGAFVLFLQSYAGIVTVVALIFCLIMFDKNVGNISDAQDKRTNYLVDTLGISDIHEDSEITVDFVEKIYLDKVGYLVHQDGALIPPEPTDSPVKDIKEVEDFIDTKTEDASTDINVDDASADVDEEDASADVNEENDAEK